MTFTRLGVCSLILLLTSLGVEASLDPSSSGQHGFVYSQSLSLDLSSDVEEEEDISFSVLYDEGCSVTSQAIMMAEEDLFEQEEGEDEDDDDDEDDDGHSSMLSNASLRRTKAFIGVSFESSPYMKTTARTATPSVPAVAALSLRGGASSASEEVLKKLFTTALVTLIFEALIGHVLEFLKIVQQTSSTDRSYAEVILEITADKGLTGLWDGFVPWGVVQAVFKGAVFGLAYDMALKILKPLGESGVLPMQLALTLAGGIGGGFQGYVLSPTLLLKTRVMTDKVFREKMSLFRTTWLSLLIGFDIVKREGLGTLMKGANVFAMKRVFDFASRYFFADLFERLYVIAKGGQPLTLLEKSVSSLLGGVASTCVTLPLDVLVAKTQDAKKAGVKVSTVALFRDELKESGWNGLRHNYMRGFEARLAHVCLTTAGK